MYISLSLVFVTAFFHTGVFFLDLPISLIEMFFIALVSPLLGFRNVFHITTIKMSIEWISQFIGTMLIVTASQGVFKSMFPNMILPSWIWIYWSGIVFICQYVALLASGLLAVYLWKGILTRFTSIPKRIHSAIQGGIHH